MKFIYPAVFHEEKDGKYHVILNATAFYPEGGGQPADKGRIDNIPVVDVQYIDGELCHIMESPLEEGAQVVGKIDWNWRSDAATFRRTHCQRNDP